MEPNNDTSNVQVQINEMNSKIEKLTKENLKLRSNFEELIKNLAFFCRDTGNEIKSNGNGSFKSIKTSSPYGNFMDWLVEIGQDEYNINWKKLEEEEKK